MNAKRVLKTIVQCPKCSGKFKVNHMSKNCYLYYLDLYSVDEIDAELLGWIKESYNLQK